MTAPSEGAAVAMTGPATLEEVLLLMLVYVRATGSLVPPFDGPTARRLILARRAAWRLRLAEWRAEVAS